MLDILRNLPLGRRARRLVWVVGLLVAAGALGAWQFGVGWEDLKGGWDALQDFLSVRPWWLFAALVLLTGLPVPSSALLVMAGAVWSDRPLSACAICLAALALNMAWTYALAAGPARGLVEKWIAGGRLRIPEIGRGDDLRLILIVRLTPGTPLFLQNYLLGFLRVPFRLYLPLSIACTGLIASGMVLAGAGAASGKLTPVLSGIGLLVAGGLLVQMVRRHLRIRAEIRGPERMASDDRPRKKGQSV